MKGKAGGLLSFQTNWRFDNAYNKGPKFYLF